MMSLPYAEVVCEFRLENIPTFDSAYSKNRLFLDMAVASVSPLDKQISLVNELAFEPEAEDCAVVSYDAINSAIDLIRTIFDISRMTPEYSVPTSSGGVALIYKAHGSEYRYRFDNGQLFVTKDHVYYFTGAPNPFSTSIHPGF